MLTELVFAAVPSSAVTRVLANDYDLTRGPLSVGLDSAKQFIFSHDSRFFFDTEPTLVQTTGTAATTAFGGFLGIPLVPSTGPNLTVAFNDIAGAAIKAGTVPEPASWAMMIAGFDAMRRRSAQAAATA